MRKKKWVGSDKKSLMEALSKKETKEQEVKEETKNKEGQRRLFKK